ncbi:MAG: hypothetical protein M1832_004456 [Thelocarpon impressellum]|nr:MAG: hypothetical protein M1832_004456 [Thelocarpon impressellum]
MPLITNNPPTPGIVEGGTSWLELREGSTRLTADVDAKILATVPPWLSNFKRSNFFRARQTLQERYLSATNSPTSLGGRSGTSSSQPSPSLPEDSSPGSPPELDACSDGDNSDPDWPLCEGTIIEVAQAVHFKRLSAKPRLIDVPARKAKPQNQHRRRPSSCIILPSESSKKRVPRLSLHLEHATSDLESLLSTTFANISSSPPTSPSTAPPSPMWDRSSQKTTSSHSSMCSSLPSPRYQAKRMPPRYAARPPRPPPQRPPQQHLPQQRPLQQRPPQQRSWQQRPSQQRPPPQRSPHLHKRCVSRRDSLTLPRRARTTAH